MVTTIGTTMALSLSVLMFIAGCNKPVDDARLAETPPVTQTEITAVIPESIEVVSHAVAFSQLVTDSTHNPGVAAQWAAARYATAGQIEHVEQRPGDALEGRRALLEENYVACGLPERIFRILQGNARPVEVSGRTSRADGLPYQVNVFTNDEGIDIVSNNCLTCHGTELFGELVIGLGNEFLDFTMDASVLTERAGALVRGEAETRAWELYADRISAISPFIKTRTVGVNPANNLTFALIAHRDAESNAWHETPLLPLPPADPPPVSVPPWWRMKKKPAMFNLGEGRGDHARIMMAASMLCSDTIDELEQIDRYAPDIRAYIASLQPPAWPFAINDSLIPTGRALFETNCSVCHGRYADEPSYPARLVPLNVVQTDPVLVEFAHGDGTPYIDWFNRSYYGNRSTAAPGPGYVAPPLDGIWATAPFLHNGSVPSIRALLNSTRRPTYWQHQVTDTNDPGGYDTDNLGWRFDKLDEGKSGSDAPARVYDTTLPGYANSGHQFGDHLSESERTAVIEYLKTL